MAPPGAFVTPTNVALNALFAGYGGHSMGGPSGEMKSVWWTQQRINEKVTREFIATKLKAEEKARLDVPIGFGGLSDYTYFEWILQKARRIFLILAECGVPNRIFAIVDASWDDEDLPLSLEAMEQLRLCREDGNNKVLSKRFHTIQYSYLLHELSKGAHIDYKSNEVIPVESANSVPPAACLQKWSRVRLPGKKRVLVKRKVAFHARDKSESRDWFMNELKCAKELSHPHIASIWATYTAKDAGYILSSFIGEHTLKTLIDQGKPHQLAKISKEDRIKLILKWLHCLSDAVAAIHRKGISHTAIRPSSILIDAQNEIAFSDVGSLPTFQADKDHDPNEIYNYSSPEEQTKKTIVAPTPKLHKRSSSVGSNFSANSSSSEGSYKAGDEKRFFSLFHRSNSNASRDTSRDDPLEVGPVPPPKPPPAPPLVIPGVPPRTHNSLSAHTNYVPPPPPPPPTKSASILSGPSLPPLPELSTNISEKADIFSLGCIFLDLITFLMKKKATDFQKHRTTKVKCAPSPLSPASALPNHPDLPAPSLKDSVRIDSSFHNNPDKISSWIDQLDRAAFGSNDDLHRGIPHLLSLTRGMLSTNPLMRPSANEVEQRAFDIITKFCGLDEDALHCGRNRNRPSAKPAPVAAPKPAPVAAPMPTPMAQMAPRRRANTMDNVPRPPMMDSLRTSRAHRHRISEGPPMYAAPYRNLPAPPPPPMAAPPRPPVAPQHVPVFEPAQIQRPPTVIGTMMMPQPVQSPADVPPPIPRRSSRRPTPFVETTPPPQQNAARLSYSPPRSCYSPPPRSSPTEYAMSGRPMLSRSNSVSTSSSHQSWRSRSSSNASYGSMSPASTGFHVGAAALAGGREMRFVDFRQNKEFREGAEVCEGRLGREGPETKAVRDVRDVEYIIDDYMRAMRVEKMREDLWGDRVELNAF